MMFIDLRLLSTVTSGRYKTEKKHLLTYNRLQ